MKLLKHQKGFTLIEFIIVTAIFVVLMGIGLVGISNLRISTRNNTSISVLISDLKSQQVRAMSGDTEGTGTTVDFGVKILTDKYVLFRGNTYDPNASTNYITTIGDNHQLATTFSNSIVVFQKVNGEILNFSGTNNSITLKNTSTNQSVNIKLNQYGTVTEVN